MIVAELRDGSSMSDPPTKWPFADIYIRHRTQLRQSRRRHEVRTGTSLQLGRRGAARDNSKGTLEVYYEAEAHRTHVTLHKLREPRLRRNELLGPGVRPHAERLRVGDRGHQRRAVLRPHQSVQHGLDVLRRHHRR